MKTILRLIVLAGLLAGTASVAFAGPGLQYWQTLNKKSQFEELKPGDTIAYVCNQCQTVTEKTIGSTAEAMDLCREGAMVMCPSCKTTVKVVTKGPPKNQSTAREITYVNEKGESCFFIAKVVKQK